MKGGPTAYRVPRSHCPLRHASPESLAKPPASCVMSPHPGGTFVFPGGDAYPGIGAHSCSIKFPLRHELFCQNLAKVAKLGKRAFYYY
eukprot:2019509-Rhodomonas_salina.1